MKKYLTYVFWGAVTLLAACGGGGGSSGSGNSNTASSAVTSSSVSSASSQRSSTAAITQSHNAGKNCMTSSCHASGGNGPRFYTAGTVYSGTNGLSGAIVRLYIHNTNTIAAQLTTDGLGNFYSKSTVNGLSDGSGNLVTGVDVEIEAPGGGLATMPGLVTNGSCNSCHGQSNGRITVN